MVPHQDVRRERLRKKGKGAAEEEEEAGSGRGERVRVIHFQLNKKTGVEKRSARCITCSHRLIPLARKKKHNRRHFSRIFRQQGLSFLTGLTFSTGQEKDGTVPLKLEMSRNSAVLSSP